MSNNLTGEVESESIEKHIHQLAAVLVRILQGCSVNPKSLLGQLSAVVESDNGEPRSKAVLASPDMHLACTQVVFVWRRDGQYLDSDGNARDLAREDDDPNFAELCAKAAPALRPDDLLDYLIAMGAVRTLLNGRVRLLTESVLACAKKPGHTVAPETVLMHLQGFLGAVEFNLLRNDGDPPPRFERACYGVIPERLVPVFQQLVATRGQNFIDSIDEWLERHRTTEGCGVVSSRVGAGAYMLLNNSNRME